MTIVRPRRVAFCPAFLPASSHADADTLLRTQMPSDPPSPTQAQRPSPHRTQSTTSPLRAQNTTVSRSVSLSPAQAIAQAWMRESAESQQQWRMADLRVKEQYLNPIRWDTGFRPEKKRNGAKM